MTQTKNVNLSAGEPYQDYFRQVNSPRKESQSTVKKSRIKRYIITLKIFYKTEFGESLQVVGSAEELGEWKTYKCPMKWTEGHVWVAENIDITSCTFFTYKYVIMF